MAKYPLYFLEGYTEISRVSKQLGWETVHFEKDGEYYTMNVELHHGVREGKAIIVDRNGITVETVVYKNGRLNGVCRHRDHNGMIRMECTVVNDVLEGEFTEYDETGKVICSGKYVNGRRIDNCDEKIEKKKKKKEVKDVNTPLMDEENEKKEGESSSGFGAAAAAGATAAAATGAATGALGGAAALLGFGSPGIAAGSWAASMMSAAWTSGIGTGFVSVAQSAGALFMNAAGGSVLAAGAAVAAPIVAGVGVAVLYRRYRKKKTPEKRDE